MEDKKIWTDASLVENQIAKAWKYNGVKLVEHDDTYLKVAEIDTESYVYKISANAITYVKSDNPKLQPHTFKIAYTVEGAGMKTHDIATYKTITIQNKAVLLTVMTEDELAMCNALVATKQAVECTTAVARKHLILTRKKKVEQTKRLKRKAETDLKDISF